MGKAPAFQFYVKDWLSDPQLQCVRPSTRGLWIDVLCYMWQSPVKGKLEVDEDDLPRLLRCNNGDLSGFLEDAMRYEFVTVTKDNKKITLINRRMFREYSDNENNRLRQQRFRDKKQCNANVTPPSSSPSPSPTAIQKKIYKRKVLSDEEFLVSLKEKFTWVDFEQAMVKMDAWLLAKPGRKKTRRFIVNWLNRIEKPMEITKGPPTDPMDRRMWEIEEMRKKDGNSKPA